MAGVGAYQSRCGIVHALNFMLSSSSRRKERRGQCRCSRNKSDQRRADSEMLSGYWQ
jgi:hypothetical protein